MAIKLGDALLYLGADDDKLKRDLDGAQEKTKGWGATMTGVLHSGGGGGGVIGVAVTTGTTGSSSPPPPHPTTTPAVATTTKPTRRILFMFVSLQGCSSRYSRAA